MKAGTPVQMQAQVQAQAQAQAQAQVQAQAQAQAQAAVAAAVAKQRKHLNQVRDQVHPYQRVGTPIVNWQVGPPI